MKTPARGQKRRTLAELLYVQPAAFKKSDQFSPLVAMLNESAALRSVRLDARAWKLLNEPRLRVEHLDTFCRTYRVPRHPFLTGFLEYKWSWAAKKAARQEARSRFIALAMESLPAAPKAMIAWLAVFEARFDRTTPLWNERFRVQTRKRANELARLDIEGWMSLFSACLEALGREHARARMAPAAPVLDLMLLESLPDPRTLKAPSRKDLRSAWRRLSLAHHPDAGGDAAYFRLVDGARKRLGL